MKILYIVSTLKKVGPTSQLLNIVSNLSEDFCPVILTLSAESADSRYSDFIASGIEIVSLNLSRLSGFFWAKRKIEEVIKDIKPDVIHSQGIRGDWLASCFSSRVPCVCTVRNFPQLDYAMTYGRVAGLIMARLHISFLKKVNKVVGVSDSVSNNLLALNVSRVVTIRNGVCTNRFKRISDNDKVILRQKHGFPVNSLIFITTGNICSRKNISRMIEQFKLTFGRDLNFILLIVGDGIMRADCEALSSGFDNILFIGDVVDVESYLNISDIYVSTSLAEGFPNSVLEALSCGLPVILSDIEPHVELLGLNYDVGSIFSLDDEGDLGNIYLKYSKECIKHYSEAAIKLIDEELSALAMAKQYQKIYLDL